MTVQSRSSNGGPLFLWAFVLLAVFALILAAASRYAIDHHTPISKPTKNTHPKDNRPPGHPTTHPTRQRQHQ
jgi:hypothetical protein